MVKHIVFWNLKDEALGNSKETNAMLVKQKLEALNGKIEGLVKLEVGFDFAKGDMSGDLALYSEFESKEALDYYQQHPEHKAVQGFVKEVRKSRIVVDYEI